MASLDASSSSSAVTVTVCAVRNFSGLKVRRAGSTVTALSSQPANETVTVLSGLPSSFTVKSLLAFSVTVRLFALTTKAARRALIVNVSFAASLSAALPSESVAFQVHSVGPHLVRGVPLTRLPDRLTPPGRSHAREYDKVPLPPVAFGRSSGAIGWPVSQS